MKGVRKLEFDTTGIGYFVAAKGFDPTKSVLNEALKKKRLGSIKVRTLKEVELPKTVARWELAVRGLQ